jgi:hypothetical protein
MMCNYYSGKTKSGVIWELSKTDRALWGYHIRFADKTMMPVGGSIVCRQDEAITKFRRILADYIPATAKRQISKLPPELEAKLNRDWEAKKKEMIEHFKSKWKS